MYSFSITMKLTAQILIQTSKAFPLDFIVTEFSTSRFFVQKTTNGGKT